MSFKIALFCAQALLIQAISSQFVGAFNGYPEGYGWPGCEGWNWAEMSLPCGEWGAAGSRMRAAEWENAALAEARYGYGLGGFAPASMAASNGGGLAVTSSSPIAPNGVSLLSENAFEGPLAVAGEIPFLGTVGLEGALPTAGAGGVAYSCGNGNVGILSEDLNGPYGAGAYGNAYGAYGAGAYGAPFAGPLAGAALSSAYGINGINGINRGCGCRV